MEVNKPHAICVPCPAQGHITPMLQLAKLLHQRGLHITFVNTEYNHRRFLKSRGPNSLNVLPDFQFKTIPDGLPPVDNIDATQDVPTLCVSTSKNCLIPFRNLTNDLNNDPILPPVSCIISDGGMSFTVHVAQELGIPVVLFWTTSACGFMGYMHFPHLIKTGLVPLKDESQFTNGYLETQVESINGMKNIRLRDLPSFIRTTDPNADMLMFNCGEVGNLPKASAVVLNTFDALENTTPNFKN